MAKQLIQLDISVGPVKVKLAISPADDRVLCLRFAIIIAPGGL
jgi:hypothetical protein